MKKTLIFLLLLTSYLHAKTEGPYVSGYAGANWMNVDKIENVLLKMDAGWTGSLAIGYKFSSKTRLESEIAYRQNEMDYIKFNGMKYGINGHAKTTSFLLNLCQDLPFCEFGFIPYLGIGGGYVVSKDKISAAGVSFKGSGTGFAWQAIGGLSYPVAECTEFGLEYRYFQARQKAQDHSVGASLRYFF